MKNNKAKLNKYQKDTPLLSTINCSIGDVSKHLDAKGLCDLFLHIKDKEKHLSNLEKYALKIIKTEAYPQELEWFKKDYKIPQENIEYVLSKLSYAR
ncbi:hypothetical protein DMB95_06935 [Campylobacter sp. MIT 12-8780]|uniref:hypothetical protein n=1 Tax=unclassified Campylobacter TaxID=2593542 RepID=UPI0010F78B79|nr:MULTISPECIES: hypothetical protein [unclassified Campylobacter]NDJ27697.1 hypothetical protein [Campylobacter sp. MIT 19-121]TKX29443.1 hypothetical protein CQA38_05020 [Campylobacter sp. MIT 12-5580]TQR40861.1 hypothetical protein DMB95_06935 [Campylobacter sp. MIT 12-8780]